MEPQRRNEPKPRFFKVERDKGGAAMSVHANDLQTDL